MMDKEDIKKWSHLTYEDRRLSRSLAHKTTQTHSILFENKVDKNSETQVETFKLRVSSDQQSKNQIYSEASHH